MIRRLVLKQMALAAAGIAWSKWGMAADAPRVGVLLLHGKNPGSSQDPSLGSLRPALEAQGWKTLMPDMPWSRQRYLDGNWDRAMAEIATHVRTLRANGAERIVLMGHSMGCPAAMAHAARGGDVEALVLLAPGHTPLNYYRSGNLRPVHDSIEEARELVKQGKGAERQSFTDINQGRRLTVYTTAQDFLSYFDPESDADMSVTAPRIPPHVSVFTAIGENDPLFTSVRRYFVDRLPANPKNRFLEVGGGHLDTPRLASEALVKWVQEVTAA